MSWHRATGRSDVVAKDGMVATSQSLSTQAGVGILQNGGNAVDAAVASAAVLDVVEPFSTGCGGDAFALIHLPGKSIPISINGSGRTGSLVTLDDLLEKQWTEIPLRGGPSVSVPGAMHMWHYVIEKYGALEFKEVLAPAIHYARNGFPVSDIISQVWPLATSILINDYAKNLYSIDGRAPMMGEIMKNKDLGDVLESVGNEGPQAFYAGTTGEAIVNLVQEHGGFLTLEDLESHTTEETKPISTTYRGVDVFEHPPNGQGFAALIMLNLMEQYDISTLSSLSSERYHIMIEAKKLAYAELYRHNTDPSFYEVPLKRLLSKEYAKECMRLINSSKAMVDYESGVPISSDTIYLATADGDGRAVSFINSLYRGFGSGLVVPGTGIKLQNRGSLMSLDPQHPNRYAPRKLPFHTIIPGALYKDKEFVGVFGIMGGDHQAQAHAQFVSNLIDYDMGPQEAIDHPRFNHNHAENAVGLEKGFPDEIRQRLEKMGHKLHQKPSPGFGGGQAILRLYDSWIAGSDFRKDGHAAGF
ncbi:MAG: gamma-glutamyltransferase [Candidatus Thorarchaeota archaeon]